MAYLNAEERAKLVNELKTLKFNQAKGKVRGLDPKGRLVYFRNSQGVGRWMTRFELPTLGIRVTLVESHKDATHGNKIKSEFDMTEVIAEALPGNNT
ncbi:MAG: hypothetical protein J0L63_05270 [Anaerolineae bacterium]|nr:hypothetical protein [Anaerolineae bacterium]MBN8618292.1 hypothetical protein [Anaerolineae bacterium]